MLLKDEWLSQYFSQGAYCYLEPFDSVELIKGFIYTKIPTTNVQAANNLFSLGFYLAEVLVEYIQKIELLRTEQELNNCGFATVEDMEQVAQIAKNAFSFSRLYQDKNINRCVASQIKVDWVKNYFQGKRGSNMVVFRKNKKVLGFMLLIGKIIDLIAVETSQARQGIASKMIAFANREVGLLSAGTQLMNKPSISMYHKCGFFVSNSNFVLHKHIN